MKEIPIIYSTEMVRAKLAGRKTQTRRLLKVHGCKPFYPDASWSLEEVLGWTFDNRSGKYFFQPYGHPRDMMWVREAFTMLSGAIAYKADEPHVFRKLKYKPSIHMPKHYARIWDQVVSIRPERLQDISEEDAIAEGVEKIINSKYGYLCTLHDEETGQPILGTAKTAFRYLWQSIHGKNSWDKNPWVWRIETRTLSLTGRPETIPPLNP